MAIVKLATDIVQINAADSETGWTSWGVGNKYSLETDVKIEGGASIGLPNKSTGDGGYGPVGFTAVNFTTQLLICWVFIIPGFTSTTSPAYIRVGSSGNFTSNYGDFYIGPSTAEWQNGSWRPIILDVGRGADNTNGTPNYSAINAIGFGANYIATALKSSTTAFDNICRGNYVEYTGVWSTSANHAFTTGTNTITRTAGSFTTDGFEVGDTILIQGTASNDGEYTLATVGTTTMTTNESLATESSVASTIDAYITPADIYKKDNNSTDDTWYASLTKNRDGIYEINYDLRIGDQSGTNRTYFRSRNEVIVFADQPLDTANQESLILKTYEDTGATTVFEMGNSVGTGDDRVGFAGTTITNSDSYFGEQAVIDLSTDITSVKIFGSTFLNVGLGISFADNTDHLITTTTFGSCGQIELGSAEARGVVFTGTIATNGALDWNDSGTIDIKDSSFLANSLSGGNGYGILVDSVGDDSITLTNIQFSGNDYDIYYTGSGTLTVYVVGGDVPTYYAPSGTVTVISSITWTFLIKNSDGVTVTNAEFRIYDDSMNQLYGIETSDGSEDYVFNGTISGNNAHIVCLSLDYLIYQQVLTHPSNNQTTVITLSIDRVYENP